MSIKKNIIANFFGQFYVALIGIFFVPIYLKYMGAEAYGLIGFYTMLQIWFFMLDMGLTPTIARETARYQGGAVDAIDLRKLLRALEGIFLIIALIGASAMIGASEIIASKWLNVDNLSLHDVETSIVLMAIIIVLRWMGGLYRSAITGFERIVWLNTFNISIATLRFIFVIPVLIYINASPITFFSFQATVAFIELSISYFKLSKLLPSVDGAKIVWDWRPLKSSLSFSLSIAFAGLVWVIVTQTDKLILSALISLSDYAYFTMAVLVASGIMIVSKPISGALLPRMTALNAENDQANLLRLYRNATQTVSVLTFPVTAVMAVFSEKLLFSWTGNSEVALFSSQVLTLYALGNGIMVLTAFPFYMQYAKGDLKLHLISNAIFLLCFIPSIYFLVTKYGVLGAGYAWLLSNGLLFLIYLPIVHHKFIRGFHLKWLINDILIIGVLPVIFVMFVEKIIIWPTDRVLVAIYILAISIFSFMLSAASSSSMRNIMFSMYSKIRISKNKS